jgi:glycosyltransferase involved in cell wall biosynthesis
MSREQPRVAVLADWWWPDTVGGAERSARSAAMELAEFATVGVFVPAVHDKVYADGPLTVHALRRPFARRAHADSVARRGIEFLTAWLLPPVAWHLASGVRGFDPDVTVATNVSRTGPWLVRRAKAGRSGFVRIYHDLSDTCWRRSRLRAGGTCATICGECRVKTRVLRAATPASAVSVCVSGFVQAELVSAGLTTPETSIVGYPMVGATATATATAPPRPGGDLVLGYLGRIDPVKGIESAIRTAAAYRRATGKAVSMVIAGEGSAGYVRTLAALAGAESIDVDFAGRLDVDAFCARVDVVLIPSRWMEPFGRVAVEVGSHGRPMLISPVGGLPEAAAVSGGRFEFADFDDPRAAARALVDLLDGDAVPGATPVTPPAAAVRLEQAAVLAVRRMLAGRVEPGR